MTKIIHWFSHIIDFKPFGVIKAFNNTDREIPSFSNFKLNRKIYTKMVHIFEIYVFNTY